MPTRNICSDVTSLAESQFPWLSTAASSYTAAYNAGRVDHLELSSARVSSWRTCPAAATERFVGQIIISYVHTCLVSHSQSDTCRMQIHVSSHSFVLATWNFLHLNCCQEFNTEIKIYAAIFNHWYNVISSFQQKQK